MDKDVSLTAGLPGVNLSALTTMDALRGWVEAQAQGWRELVAMSGQTLSTYGWRHIQSDAWASLAASWNAESFFAGPPDVVRRELRKRMVQVPLVPVQHPLVQRAKATLAFDEKAAETMLALAANRSPTYSDQHDFLRTVALLATTGYYDDALARHAETMEEIRSVLAETTVAHAQHKARVDTDTARMRDEAKRALDTFGTECSTALSDVRLAATAGQEGFDAQRAGIQGEWERIRVTYDQQLKLSEPRRYWQDKLEKHETFFKRWRRAFFMLAVGALAMLAGMTFAFIEVSTSLSARLGGHAWVLPVMMLGVPAFMALWLLRVCGRQWLDHLARCEDARERVVMVETFLALSRDEDTPGGMAEAHIGVILGALFRAGPGSTLDDSPPAGVIDALAARLAAK